MLCLSGVGPKILEILFIKEGVSLSLQGVHHENNKE